jgi:Zn-dependent oligopeptidase
MKFYTSDYYNRNKVSTAWFDDLEKAEEFAKKDYHDPIVIHNLTNDKAITEAKYNVAMTNFELSNK